MLFEFATAARIVFGEGAASEVAPAAAAMGRRALLVTGERADRSAALARALEAAGVTAVPFRVSGEPAIGMIAAGTVYARGEGCDVVVAVGGGSAIDAGKALAAMLTNPGEPLDYLEVVGRGQPLRQASAPFIAVPTTAGTGSEVTRNAVLAAPERGVKASLRSPYLLARLAVVDSELTLDLPPALTASTGLDALTQLIEPYVSVRANPMTDLYAAEGLRTAGASLPRAWANSGDREARRGMCWASLLGGLALANAGLGAVHGFAAPVGGMFPAPHGAVCAALLAPTIEINVEALRRRAPESRALRRYHEVARLLTGKPHATAADGVEWIAALCRRFEIPPLSAYGVTAADIPLLASRAAEASSMKGNPIALTQDERAEIIGRAI
ncbi:MAG: iron-containing alcohol dehydrogenase [Bryobacteraceae bacterium]|jgi:alcohol dehydrogenase class IV